jgi:hypothetical protein
VEKRRSVATEGRDEAASRDVDEVDGDEARRDRALGVLADTPDVAGVAQADHRDAVLRGALDAERHGLRRDGLAEAELAVEQREGAAIGHDVRGLPLQDVACSSHST